MIGVPYCTRVATDGAAALTTFYGATPVLTSTLYPVLACVTGPDYMDEGVRVSASARSATGAIRACREEGWQVLSVGGLVDLVDTDSGPAWCVTVHPAR